MLLDTPSDVLRNGADARRRSMPGGEGEGEEDDPLLSGDTHDLKTPCLDGVIVSDARLSVGGRNSCRIRGGSR